MSDDALSQATGGNPARSDLFAIVWRARYLGEAEAHARTQADLLAHQQALDHFGAQIKALEENINFLAAERTRLECDLARKQTLLDEAGLVDGGPSTLDLEPSPETQNQ